MLWDQNQQENQVKELEGIKNETNRKKNPKTAKENWWWHEKWSEAILRKE